MSRTSLTGCSQSAQKIGLRAHLLLAGSVLFLGAIIHPAYAVDFKQPTRDELSMTSLPGYPGAPAVVLFREDLTKDDLHSRVHYERVKILTEEGKKYANVELPYLSTGGGWLSGDSKNVDDITGRTIHPDGTIIPFTGKPYLKVIEKGDGYKVQEKVFTLPDVEVGSIIEYRYAVRISDNYFESPTWRIQDDIFVKEAHFAWWPTTEQLLDEDQKLITSISWFPVLPEGVKIETHATPPLSSMVGHGPSNVYEVHVKDVPPRVKEEHMPPLDSFSYGVHFAFTPYRTREEYWQAAGKQWSKHVNSFASQNGALKDATNKAIAGASTPDEKLRKIYAAVMALENTQFTREHGQSEDKAAGMGQIKVASDLLVHGRGTPNQLAELFIGMARTAGLNASAMYVPDRSERLFTPYWMEIHQLDDVIAIVSVDGKDLFLDPGSRFCPYGQLAWQHTYIQGVRQTDGNNTSIVQTPGTPYKDNHVTRIANLTMDAHGQITGKVDLTFTGSPALRWRQEALRSDEEGIRKDLRHHAEEILPKTLEIEVSDVKDMADYGKPLVVSYKVTGSIGNPVGKRLMVPADIFLVNESATFPHEKRELAVDFHYPWYTQDAVRLNLPHEMAVEAVPAQAKFNLPNTGFYNIDVAQAPTSITTRRNFAFGAVLMMPNEYPDLRKFYSQFESKDQETIILKAAPTTAAAATPSPQGN